jgi:hypothetical protein
MKKKKREIEIETGEKWRQKGVGINLAKRRGKNPFPGCRTGNN